MTDNLKNKALHGILWSSIDKFSVQGVQFVIGLVLARLLVPGDFGLIGMLAIFLAVSQSFIDSGFTQALIRKQNRTEEDFSTVFYFSIIVSIFFYFVLFFSAPYIAIFYNTPVLERITKVVSINLVINSLTIVQRAKYTIKVDFKTQMKISLVAVFISGATGIYLACNGYGVWSLVIQSIVSGGTSAFLFWLYSKWVPKMVFSVASFREMFAFGSKMLMAGLIDTVYRNIYTIIIGKKFSTDDLGYYTRAYSHSSFFSANLTGILQRVTFPVLSSIQDDDARLMDAYRKVLRLSAFIVFPLMMGVAALAEPFVRLVLTDKWEGAILLLQVLCFAQMWYPVHAINLNLLQVKGRSDLFLRLEIIKKTIGGITLCFTVPLGVKAMCIGMIFTSLIALVINTHYTGILIKTGFLTQMKDLLPSIGLSFSMGFLIWGITKFNMPHAITLLVGVTFGTAYYAGISYYRKSQEFQELVNIATEKFKLS